ncbi:peptide deformylase [Halanaerobium salsuginis]|jgi:peptide deformylase|uniref:Peptide deformylase n=1 Tax=Halanaerobium salsuginis TaxID=29563 RepID=A0A1I4MBL6_9FIRM|nr:peptide deformylase [Halanaerobium salsuginis]SFM00445.1 peptide deformylase [Halanaerobium salsuginis]
MAIQKVLMLGNPDLRKQSTEIIDFGQPLAKIIKDLKDTLLYLQIEKKIGRALAAPQIGYLKKVIYYNSNDEEIIMVNPEIIWQSKKMFEIWDSCYSFDAAFFVKVCRYWQIKVKYQTRRGEL